MLRSPQLPLGGIPQRGQRVTPRNGSAWTWHHSAAGDAALLVGVHTDSAAFCLPELSRAEAGEKSLTLSSTPLSSKIPNLEGLPLKILHSGELRHSGHYQLTGMRVSLLLK